MTNFIKAAQAMRDRVSAIVGNYQIPEVRNLVLAFLNDFSQPTYLKLTPAPTVREFYPERDSTEGVSSLGGVSKQYEVQLSKSYPREALDRGGVSFWLDADLDDGMLVGGKALELVELDDRETLHWVLTLTEKTAQTGFYS